MSNEGTQAGYDDILAAEPERAASLWTMSTGLYEQNLATALTAERHQECLDTNKAALEKLQELIPSWQLASANLAVLCSKGLIDAVEPRACF